MPLRTLLTGLVAAATALTTSAATAQADEPSARMTGAVAAVTDPSITRAPTVSGADLDFSTPSRTLTDGTPDQVGLVPERIEQIVPHVASYLEPGPDRPNPSFAGATVLAAHQGVIVEHAAVGHAVRYESFDAHGEPVELPAGDQVAATPDTVYDLASVTKLFTVVAAMSMSDDGVLDLTAPVTDHLPEFGQDDPRKLTIEVQQLMNHTSGLRAWAPIYQQPSYDERIAAAYDAPLKSDPGTEYRYSDLNLIILGKVIEAASSAPLDQVVHDRITAPLGMDDTGFNPPAELRDRIAATEYLPARGMVRGEVHDENAWSLGGVAGHAGIFSTASDLAIFAQMVLNGGRYGPGGDGRILAEQTVREIFTNENSSLGADAARGRGFQLDQRFYMDALSSPVTAGHTGFTGTSIVIDPLSESFVILLTNRVHPTHDWGTTSEYRRSVARDLDGAIPVEPVTLQLPWHSSAN